MPLRQTEQYQYQYPVPLSLSPTRSFKRWFDAPGDLSTRIVPTLSLVLLLETRSPPQPVAPSPPPLEAHIFHLPTGFTLFRCDPIPYTTPRSLRCFESDIEPPKDT